MRGEDWNIDHLVIVISYREIFQKFKLLGEGSWIILYISKNYIVIHFPQWLRTQLKGIIYFIGHKTGSQLARKVNIIETDFSDL